MDLVLGTAQWGAGYGLTNTHGALSDADVGEIVALALAGGIVAADTHRATNAAHGYGHAQLRLRPWAARFAITTKVFGGASADLPVLDQLRDSLTQLGAERVHACLVHDWYDLSDAQAADTVAALLAAVDEGLVERVGVSAYAVVDVERAARLFPVLGAVQVPCSAVDQRVVDAPVMERVHAAGTQVQVRSVFLQGLLLEPDAPAALAQHPDIRRFHRTFRDSGIDPVEACLSFVRALPWVDRVVVGVTGADELRQIANAWAAPAMEIDWPALASSDPDLVDPRRWLL